MKDDALDLDLGQLWDDNEFSRHVAAVIRGEDVNQRYARAVQNVSKSLTELIINARRERMAATGLPPDEDWERGLRNAARIVETGVLASTDSQS